MLSEAADAAHPAIRINHKTGVHMTFSNLLILAAVLGGAAYPQSAPGLLERIGVPDKALTPRNPTLTGTWMLELRRPGQTLVTAGLVTYFAEGTCIGPTADGNTSPSQGVWVRITDGKFLQTMYVFTYDANRALTTISKVRVNVQLSDDGLTAKGTTEAVVLDKDGKEIATIPGGSYRAVRLTAEKPADFEAFVLSTN